MFPESFYWLCDMGIYKDLRGAQASSIPRPLRVIQGPEAMEDARQPSLGSQWRHAALVILALQDATIPSILRELGPSGDMEIQRKRKLYVGCHNSVFTSVSHTQVLRTRHFEKATSR